MSHTRVAAAVVVIKDGKILLLQRKGSEGSGTWAIPGGKVDFMEDPKDACAREMLEETGLTANSLDFITYTNDIHKEPNKHFITMRFACKDFSGEPKIMEPENLPQSTGSLSTSFHPRCSSLPEIYSTR